VSRAVVLLLLPVLAASAHAGRFEGRLALEMEYVGESYRTSPELDLPTPDLPDDPVIGTTTFRDDTWLPGPRADLRFTDEAGPRRVDLRSLTLVNAERFQQELGAAVEWRGPDGARWRLVARGALRDEENALAGHGDWNVEGEIRRDHPLRPGLLGRLEVRARRSATRGDTTSFVFDYDRLEARAGVFGTGASAFDLTLRGVQKSVRDDDAGTYREGGFTAAVRPPGSARFDATLDLRLRDYEIESVAGHDFHEGDLALRARPWHGGSLALGVEAGFLAADYREEDDLYYDYLRTDLYLPGTWSDLAWRVDLGPRIRWLRDLTGGDRDYLQTGARAEVSRLWGSGGFLQAALEGGFRDYRAEEAERIDLQTLSTTLFRSDAWVWNALVMADIPLGAGFAMNLLADSLLEVHEQDSERILVTFVTLSLVRPF
jgi:hypothetical protein